MNLWLTNQKDRRLKEEEAASMSGPEGEAAGATTEEEIDE